MKDSTRRILLFIIVVVAGSVLVLFDIPAVIMIIGIVALAFLVLFINGSIHLPDISFKRNISGRKSKPDGQSPAAINNDASGKSQGVSTGKVQKTSPGKSSSKGTSRFGLLKDSFSSMGKAFSVLAKDISRSRTSAKTREQQTQKLDQMLEGSIQGRVSDIRSLKEANPEIIPVAKRTVEDPFTTLVTEPMNTELLDSVEKTNVISLDDITLGSEMGEYSPDEDISKLDVALDQDEESITIDMEQDDEVANILAAHQGDLDPESQGGELPAVEADINGLDEMDLGNIDLDQELDIGDDEPETPDPKQDIKMTGAPSKSPQPAPVTGNAAPKTSEQQPKDMADSMIAFSSGKGMDDDLMSSLKSEATKTKKESHASLIRDLKDVKVPVQDLEKELGDVLAFNRQKKI